MSEHKVGLTMEDVVASIEKARALMGAEAPGAQLLYDVQKRLESHLSLIRLNDQKNIRRLRGTRHPLRTMLEVMVSLTSTVVLLAVAGVVVKDAESIGDAIRNIALTVPALAVMVPFVWYIVRGRYMAPIFYSGPRGADRRFAGLVAYWKVTENTENVLRLHVYGMFQATPRWLGLSWVEIGGVHNFRITRVVGESPLKIVFALPHDDVGLWKRHIDDNRWNEIQRDTRDRAPEAAHLLTILSDLLDDLESRRSIQTDREDIIRAGEIRTWRPHVEEAARLLQRLHRLADLPSSESGGDDNSIRILENPE